jgi:hypothetical protein
MQEIHMTAAITAPSATAKSHAYKSRNTARASAKRNKNSVHFTYLHTSSKSTPLVVFDASILNTQLIAAIFLGKSLRSGCKRRLCEV